MLLITHAFPSLLPFHSLDFVVVELLNFRMGDINQRGDPNGESKLVTSE